MRAARRIYSVVVAGLLLVALPLAGAPGNARPNAPEASAARLPYSGLGTWVDLYNKGPWRHPERVIEKMTTRGAQTLFLETSSYKFKRAIVHPKAVGEYLDLAHANGITVVAWYVPSFKPVKRDLRRFRAAAGFLSPQAATFDSFALDIEATVVQDVAERNHRVRRLSRMMRRNAGASYPLGAIIPDPVGSVYWTDFPYKSLAKNYDVFLPMCYFTYRVDGAKAVYRFVRAGIRAVHERTGLSHAAVHPIGGIADVARIREVRAYVRAVADGHATGGSLYDLPITKPAQWKALAPLRARRMTTSSSSAPAHGVHAHLR